MLRFLNSTPVRLVTLLLVAQAAVLYSSIRPEAIPAGRPLAQFPRDLAGWHLLKEGVIDAEVQEVLKADDLLTRIYGDASGRQLDFYVAAFRSQRNGKAPHSPKNCLPGSGWVPEMQDEIQVDTGAGHTIPVNRYVVAHGENRSLVLYWYQSRDRAVADEYRAKFWVIADAIRYNRTDTAILRVTAPVFNRDNATAEKTATDFVRDSYSTIRTFLPE